MNLSIRARLAVAFASLALLCAGQGVVSIGKALTTEADLTRFKTTLLPAIVAINKLQDAVSEVRIKEYRLFTLSSSPELLVLNTQQYQQARKTAKELVATYRAIEPAGDTPLFARYLADWRRYEQLGDAAYRLSSVEGRPQAALEAVGSSRRLFDSIRDELEALVEDENAKASTLIERSHETATATVRMTWISMALAFLAAVATTVLSLRDISRPITVLTAYMKRLASGDLSRQVPFLQRRDEMGAMAAAVEVFQARMVQNAMLETEAAKARDEFAAQRKSVMHEMADHFERIMSGVVSGTAARATDMRATAAALAAAAAETAQRSATVATAANDTAGSASSVAEAAEALGQSVQTIYQQVEGSSGLARVAATEARDTEGLIEELVTGASKIGDIVSMISTIASQTNLLALNAAIEAAAAGEGGRGFAVVAQEVKALAKQTSQATAAIAEQIGRIQNSTGQTAGAIRSIAGRITEISDRATAISVSVGMQQTATRDIIDAIQTAADGTHQVTGNITYVASAADATGTAAHRVLDMASDLAGQSVLLRAEADRFLSEVRAA